MQEAFFTKSVSLDEFKAMYPKGDDMQDRIKQLAVEVGFNLDKETGLILDTAGVYSVDDAARNLAQAVARECAQIASETLEEDQGEECGSIYGTKSANAIRARFGLATPPSNS